PREEFLQRGAGRKSLERKLVGRVITAPVWDGRTGRMNVEARHLRVPHAEALSPQRSSGGRLRGANKPGRMRVSVTSLRYLGVLGDRGWTTTSRSWSPPVCGAVKTNFSGQPSCSSARITYVPPGIRFARVTFPASSAWVG